MKKIILAVFALLVLFPSVTLAANFKNPEQSGDVVVNKEESFRNLYTAGNTVEINADIKGDLVAAGANVNVNGNIERGVLLAGENVFVKGNIGQNARVAGKNISFNGKISDDLVVAGGNIKVNKDAVIEGDLVVVAGQLTIDGKVLGNIIMGGGGIVVINGEVKKDVKIEEVESLTLGETAIIGGKLSYKSHTEGAISEKAKIAGGIDFQKMEVKKGYASFPFTVGALFATALFKLVALVLSLILLIALWPKSLKKLTSKMLKNPGSAFLWGLISMIVIPVLGIIVTITVFGINIGLAAFFAYVALLLVVSILTVLPMGSLFIKQIKKSTDYPVDMRVALIGSAIGLVLSFIPIVGWIVILIFFVMTWGEIIKSIAEGIKSERKG